MMPDAADPEWNRDDQEKYNNKIEELEKEIRNLKKKVKRRENKIIEIEKANRVLRAILSDFYNHSV